MTTSSLCPPSLGGRPALSRRTRCAVGPSVVLMTAAALGACVGLARAPGPTPGDAADLPWTTAFAYDGASDWRTSWTLDGRQATVTPTPDGLAFRAGPTRSDDASHAVLWTRPSFKGDLRVRFDYTRLDSATHSVNILYLDATGTGRGPYVEDLAVWAALREVPAMRVYYENLDALHVSFAAYPNDDEPDPVDYVRARRYPVAPGASFAATTGLEPTYADTGLFRPGVPYRVTVTKRCGRLAMRVEGDGRDERFEWDLAAFPPTTHGRVGLRHMATRAARYADVRVETLPPDAAPCPPSTTSR